MHDICLGLGYVYGIGASAHPRPAYQGICDYFSKSDIHVYFILRCFQLGVAELGFPSSADVKSSYEPNWCVRCADNEKIRE